jgi:hypothetical protein
MVTAGLFVFILPKVMRPHPEWPEGDQIRGDRSCSQSIVSLAGLRNSQNSETPCRIGGAFSYGPAQS